MKHIVTRISLLFLWACIGFGQEFRATLQGTIIDPTQAAIPGAMVTLHNNDTAIERKTSADGSGFYIFQFVTPGTYSLMVSASGFRNNVQEHIVLTVSQDARQDVKLELGAASETVSVVSDVALIQPESSTLGYAVSTDTIDVLPVKGHSSLMIYNLSPGMLSTRIGEDARPNDTATNMMFGVSGAPMATSDVAVDGVPNTVDINRGAVLAVWVPALSSVAELKVQSGTLPAEYGFSAGSFVNVVIKSGTNDLHGSAYEYLKNSKMDADLFFARGLGQPLAASAANTFGGSIGGPVYLPKLYNGRNRSFFFVDYEGSREGTANNAISTVPTAKMRNGDFSEVPNAIYNPYSTQNVGGTWVRAPFPGNIIPPLVQDPVGRSIMTYYPLPNITASNPAAPWASDYSFSSKFPRSYNMLVVKGDYMVSSRDQAFVRVNYGTAYILYPTSFDGIAAPAKQVDYRPHSGVAVGNTYSLSGHTTLDVRLGWARGWEKFVPYSQGFNASKTLGLPGYFENMVQDPAFPTVAVTSFLGLSGTWDYVEPGDTYSLQGSVSMQRGKHLFKTGGDSRLIRGSFFANQNPGGIFNFGLTQTAGPNVYTPAVGTGFGMASLMVGYGSGGSVDVNPALAIQNFYYGLFFEDNYRVSHKLTLNYGIRYEYESPRTERFNRTTHGFAYNTPSPLQVPGLNLQGGLIYAGVNGQPRGLYTPDRNNFAPRIGFAYSLTNKIVLRGGYALSYIPMISLVQPTGFSVSTPWVPTTDSLTFTAPLSNPYPGGPLRAIGNSQGLLTLLGQNVAFIDPGDHTPRFHNWQFNVQRQFPSQTLIEIGYVGSRTIGTFGGLDNGIVPTVDVNQMNPQYLSQGAALLQQVPNPFYGTITSGALSGTTVQQMQLLKPYPQFTGVTRMYPAIGNVIYHSMQLQMQKRMANGVTAVIAYTVSKNINDLNTAQNAYDRQASRSVGRWDIPQRLTTSIAWQLPFGRKRLLLGNASRALDTAVGGWELSVFNTFQSGLPLAFSLARATLGANGNRPNVVGNPATGVSGSIESHLNHYFNTSAFVQPPDFTFGNVSPFVGSVRAPGMNAIDTTLSKTFPITERLKLEFRCSAYNLPNHPVFSAPNTSFGDPNFGRVTGQANFGREMEFALRLVF